ncbi:uncharacterized protein LOC141601025 [Silene latifolia]|uniref:uncharacterized protein LOC141601025 n=1 Tax=Silene latifolia TaxID=37657 RepID=UPI003D76A601
MERNSLDPAPVIPPSNAMSDMPISPTSVASSGHFPFTASDIPGMGVDTSALDTTFRSRGILIGLQFQLDGGDGHSKDSLRSLAQILWNFSLSDLTTDLSNLGDLGALGNYPGSPFLHFDSDILLDSPEQDDIVRYIKRFLVMNLDHSYPDASVPPVDYCDIESAFLKNFPSWMINEA